MARHYGKVLTSIWNDADFRALTGDAQRIYLMLITQADITSVGTLPITMRRWVGYASDGTSKGLQRAITELENAMFVVLDWDREELLVRSFVRWDEGWKNGLRLKAIQSAATVVASPNLQVVLSAEMDRLGIKHAIPQPPETSPLEGASKGLRTDLEAPRTVVTYVSSTHSPQSTILKPQSGNRSTSEPAPRRKPETTMPDDWHPKQIHHDHAKPGIDVTVEELKFRAWTQANDRRYRNWDAGFTVWLGNARPAQYSTQRAGPQMSTGEQRALVPLEIARRLEAEENNHHRQIGNGS